jgi:solute carrier family 6 (neurotransmitter transporter, glycine) member 5/9
MLLLVDHRNGLHHHVQQLQQIRSQYLQVSAFLLMRKQSAMNVICESRERSNVRFSIDAQNLIMFLFSILRDALIVSSMDTFTSILGGFTTFAILGNLANRTEKHIKDVIKESSFGLAFITYPESISKIASHLPPGSVWPSIMAIMFFLMLFTLGVGSAVGLLNNLATNLKDYFPRLKYWQFALAGCTTGFLIGLIYVCQGGIHIASVMDLFGGQLVIFFLALIELIGIVWIYGIENICWDVEFMLKRKVSAFWKISWFIVMPVYFLTIAVYWIATFNDAEGDYQKDIASYPSLVKALGWTVLAIGLAQVLIAVGYIMANRKDSVVEKVKYLVSPDPDFGPANNKTRAEWENYKENKRREFQQIASEEGHSWVQRKFLFLIGRYP